MFPFTCSYSYSFIIALFLKRLVFMRTSGWDDFGSLLKIDNADESGNILNGFLNSTRISNPFAGLEELILEKFARIIQSRHFELCKTQNPIENQYKEAIDVMTSSPHSPVHVFLLLHNFLV